MNYIIIKQEKKGYHFIKKALVNIIKLVNQLYKSKSTYPKRLKYSKIYFLENQISNLIK